MILPPRPLPNNEWPPDYSSVYEWRQNQVIRIYKEKLFDGALSYYGRPENINAFICHWCCTVDPRNAMKDLPVTLPFVLFERQAQLTTFLLGCLMDEADGIIDKSRDMGVTWLACAISVWLWRFRPGASIGWGSRKEQLVDKLGDPDSIFEKLRILIRWLPRFFWPRGFNPVDHMTYMRIINPENEATITGEAGDNIGRGGRKLIVFKDESSHYEHPESIEASLSATTRIQIDISTTAGIGTVFDRKLEHAVEWLPGKQFEKGQLRKFVADWRDHPEKTDEWHAIEEKTFRSAGLLHVFRQEVDRDPRSAVEGIIIPGDWVRAAIDAHLKLGFVDDGLWSGALDVADEGGDLNALTFRKGVVLREASEWGEGDTGFTTRETIGRAKGKEPVNIQYDVVGVGAGVKAESNRLKTEDAQLGITLIAWNGGAAVQEPERRVVDNDPKAPFNKDFYSNMKAQAWWSLRRRFERTYRMINEGIKYRTSELISIDSRIPLVRTIERELSQPTVKRDGKLRLAIEKKPEGARSPNLGDSIVMNYFPMRGPLVFTQAQMDASRRR